MVEWHHLLNGYEFKQICAQCSGRILVKDREAWHAAVHGATKSRT